LGTEHLTRRKWLLRTVLLIKGDDDPIDIVDLSSKERKILDVIRVKVLGCFCLIDEGELDWKVLVMDVE
jgi:inorganic pyrophosphatase